MYSCASDHGDQVHIMPFKNQPSQQWRLVGNRVMKNQQECLDIAGAERRDSADVISFHYKGSVNQHWHPEYIHGEPKGFDADLLLSTVGAIFGAHR